MKIKTFETTLIGRPKVSEIEIKEFELPRPNSRNSGRKYESTNRRAFGPYWQKVFEQNEIAAYERKAKTNDQLRREFLAANPSDQALRFRFKISKQTIGMYRKEYNQQKLYQAQPIPFIMSYQYDESGYIVVGGRFPSTYMFFQDCYARCVHYKIADPRFVPPEYLVEIRNRQIQGDKEWLQWIVPNEKEIAHLKRFLGIKELYNSVNFAMGWTREETPIDYDPITEH